MSAEPSELSPGGKTGEDAVQQGLADKRAEDKERSQFDYIIVGSGAGGGPLAARLVYAGKRVLVIEAGSGVGGARERIGELRDAGNVRTCPVAQIGRRGCRCAVRAACLADADQGATTRPEGRAKVRGSG